MTVLENGRRFEIIGNERIGCEDICTDPGKTCYLDSDEGRPVCTHPDAPLREEQRVVLILLKRESPKQKHRTCVHHDNLVDTNADLK